MQGGTALGQATQDHVGLGEECAVFSTRAGSCFLLGVTVLYKIPVLWVGTLPEFSNQRFIFLVSYLIYFEDIFYFQSKGQGKIIRRDMCLK